MRYLLYGLAVESDLPLPLDEFDGTEARSDVEVRMRQVTLRGELLARPEAVRGFSCWRAGEVILLEWPGARFEVCPTHILVDSTLPLEATGHLLMQAAWVVLLTARGQEALHASVVAHDGRALAIMGESGNGKSTGALSLIDRGWSLVTDDVLALTDDGLVPPGPRFMRLLCDAAAGRPGSWDSLGKFRFIPPMSDRPEPLSWVVVLHQRYGCLRPLCGIEAVDAVISHVYNDLHTHSGQLERRLDLALRIVGQARVFGAPPRSLSGAMLADITDRSWVPA